MEGIEYRRFDRVNPAHLLPVLNETAVRTHLIEHAMFDSASVKQWIAGKLQLDALPGCRVRVVYVHGVLAGWCGLQPDPQGIEVAIVLARAFWGFGPEVFNTVQGWAREFNHEVIVINLLNSRQEYRYLKKKAFKVTKSEYQGSQFTTYFFSLS